MFSSSSTVPKLRLTEICALLVAEDSIRFHDNGINSGASASSSSSPPATKLSLGPSSCCRNQNWAQPIWRSTFSMVLFVHHGCPQVESVVNWSPKQKANTLPAGSPSRNGQASRVSEKRKRKRRKKKIVQKQINLGDHHAASIHRATAKKTAARNSEEKSYY